jgi:hypothetical protein
MSSKKQKTHMESAAAGLGESGGKKWNRPPREGEDGQTWVTYAGWRGLTCEVLVRGAVLPHRRRASRSFQKHARPVDMGAPGTCCGREGFGRERSRLPSYSALLDILHRLVVQAEVVADLMNHDVPHQLRHLLGIVAVFLDRTLIDVNRIRQHVAV